MASSSIAVFAILELNDMQLSNAPHILVTYLAGCKGAIRDIELCM